MQAKFLKILKYLISSKKSQNLNKK